MQRRVIAALIFYCNDTEKVLYILVMKEIFHNIWELALPYQDKRDDNGHAQTTLDYAIKLTDLEKGDEDIIIPAIILHDIGWSQLSGQSIAILFDPGSTPEQLYELRIQHQNESVRLATGILNDIDYPPSRNSEILTIISEHDTRRGFISKNEGLVRDADKLWRYSQAGFEADVRRFGRSFQDHYERMDEELHSPEYLYSKSAMQMALAELEQRKSGK